MIGVIGIIISLALLMYLAYRGVSVLILAPILALVAVIFMGGTPLLPTYTEVFMVNLANYVKQYFPIFLLGAIFGKIMEDTGCANSIASFIAKKVGKKRAILAVVLSCAVLTYGGVSLFVVAFAVYPIAAHLFKESDIPKRLIPGSIALGAFTFTMTAFPGTPQIQNAIPMPFFGTTTWAAPILGTICGLFMLISGVTWLNYRAKKAATAGEGYGVHKNENIKESTGDYPNFFKSMIPILLVLICNLILVYGVFPNYNGKYLTEAPYNTTLQKVQGIWSLIIALIIGIIVAIVLNYKRLTSVKESVNKGVMGSLLPIFNTASEVGYGNVIASLASFVIIKEFILGVSSNPLVSEAISVNILAGITGSASGGLSIALGALGQQYLQMANTLGINPEALHRIATIACGGLDSLPHNGAVITLLAITGLTHRESYKDIGMVSVVIPVVTTALAVILASLGVN